MRKSDVFLVPEYAQEEQGFTRKVFQDGREEVSYAPKSHIRIWYNNQTENYPMHHHDALEVVIPTENDYIVIANQKTFRLKVGDILFIPPKILHELQCCGEGARFIFLIQLDFLNTLQDFKLLYPLSIEPFLCNRTVMPTLYSGVHDSFMRMVDAYFARTVMWETFLFSIFLECIYKMGQEYYRKNGGNANSPTAQQPEYYEQFAELLNYIDDNFTENLTLDQVADYMGFSKYHFSRLFKEHVNMTFYDYLRRRRINAAQSLLSTPMSITDIAFKTGFNNLTTFCRCFKKYTNCSPTEYRSKVGMVQNH